MKCKLCKKQDVGKAENNFSIRLDNHRKDIKRPDAILACKYFQNKSHVFKKHTKFITIDQLTSIIKSNCSHVTNTVKFRHYISKTI